MLPYSIFQSYDNNDSIHDHNTRRSNILRVPHGSKSFTNVSPRILNVLNTITDFDVTISIEKYTISTQFFGANVL